MTTEDTAFSSFSQQGVSEYPLILASTSPRRRELLASLGLSFQVVPPPVDEASIDVSHLAPAEQVRFLSVCKAESVAAQYPDAIVIGSDTLVAIEDRVLGKPRHAQEAMEMLTVLQNAAHTVYSGITVFTPAGMASDVLATRVWMRPLSQTEIERYVQTGEPLDKAGAYAIQGVGSVLVERIEGCYFNVVGMSLYLLNQLFERLGLSLLAGSSCQMPR